MHQWTMTLTVIAVMAGQGHETLSTSHVDAFDHCYLPSNDFDRFVNPTHDYYRRVGQGELDDQEHSYAFPMPSGPTGVEESLLGFDSYESMLEPSTSYVKHTLLSTKGTADGVGARKEGTAMHTDIYYCGTCAHIQDLLRLLANTAVTSLRQAKGAVSSISFDLSFINTLNLRMRLHVRAIHTPEVKYKCEVCDRFFKTTSERRHHMTRAHMGK
ncbi:zinc finger, C2H2 type [Ancylostoma caninum]|uniref:Zinc finger, C2H2 type n=1 Tax=Ancylostoma caninum TaxID=29170 RepID=A0A368H4M4_ANCCA|nr:zinc finger, C2H2 type [Ancylostoma caninum]